VSRTEPERRLEEEAEWEEAELPPPPALGREALQAAIEALRARLDTHVASEHFGGLMALKDALLEELLQPSFWDDQEHARDVNRTIYHLDRITKRLLDLQRRAESLTLPAGTVGRGPALVARLAARYQSLQREATLAELELLAIDGSSVSTSGVHIRILPMPAEGSSGSEPWPLVLLGMYEGWAHRHGYEVEIAAGTEASLVIRGGNLAGILAGEAGVHKRRTLVSKGNGRQTRADLALVEVGPLPATQETAGRRSSLADVARLYSFGRSHYVRDPRTGERSNRARDVLHGDIDEFLLAYLSRQLPHRAATG
jgi:hypothetical protein